MKLPVTRLVTGHSASLSQPSATRFTLELLSCHIYLFSGLQPTSTNLMFWTHLPGKRCTHLYFGGCFCCWCFESLKWTLRIFEAQKLPAGGTMQSACQTHRPVDSQSWRNWVCLSWAWTTKLISLKAVQWQSQKSQMEVFTKRRTLGCDFGLVFLLCTLLMSDASSAKWRLEKIDDCKAVLNGHTVNLEPLARLDGNPR